ncbi:hypothetical protein ARSEF1564_010028 [Beauveria bassiana]
MAPFPSKPNISVGERLAMILKLLTIFPASLAVNILRILVLSVTHGMKLRPAL